MPQPSTPQKNKNVKQLILLLVNTVLFFGLYRTLLFYAEKTQETFLSFCVMLLYMLLLLGFVLGYLIYNRFFTRENLTPQQLPDSMTTAEKQAFLEDAKTRKSKSKWMMLIIFPLVVTFLMDAIDLFLLDFFR